MLVGVNFLGFGLNEYGFKLQSEKKHEIDNFNGPIMRMNLNLFLERLDFWGIYQGMCQSNYTLVWFSKGKYKIYVVQIM